MACNFSISLFNLYLNIDCIADSAVDTAKLILEKASSEEARKKIINSSDPSTRSTALHFAAQKNHVEFVNFLLSIIDSDNEMLTV